jgi:UDP-glucuronate 4-epimerase
MTLPRGTPQTILVTGVAGFIGAHVAKRLLEMGYVVVGIDNLNHYYDVQLKRDRLTMLASHDAFRFERMDLADRAAMSQLFSSHAFHRVFHLAAQAGVRYSIENPFAYADSNLTGMLTVLDGCQRSGVEHLVYASSSSVYGLNASQPFSTSDSVDHPVSFYAATKRANELMAHSYSNTYGLPTTGLRFFTVYGPWGRPDMALYKFTRAIFLGEPIEVYHGGTLKRDFTYIDDVVEGIIRVRDKIPHSDLNWDSQHPVPWSSSAPFRLYNIGSHRPVLVSDFISILEKAIGREAKKIFLPMQMGDVSETFADIEPLATLTGFTPSVPLEIGIANFVAWYREYYSVNEQSLDAVRPNAPAFASSMSR